MSIKGINMIGPHHICIVYVATAGRQGPLMGSDEQEIVLLIYIIVDVIQNKVVGVQQYPIRPLATEMNETILSEEILAESALTDDLVKSAGRLLENAIADFDAYCSSLHLDPNSHGFRLVTDGQLPLRQCLHPEACRKDLELPLYYTTFHDLRKEVARYLGKPEDVPQSVEEMLQRLEIKPEAENEYYKKEAKDMINIVQRLIADGYRFDAPETVNLVLEPGICSKDEEVDDNCVLKARGLPWQSSDQDIAKFFRGLNIAKGGVALCLSAQGRRNGEALIRFVSQEHRDMALKRHKHHMGCRYIECDCSQGKDFVNVAGGANTDAQAFLARSNNIIVRMRGLPYDCTAKEVLEFFASGEQSCTVKDGEDGVLFVKKWDGKATGDAFVLFTEESDALKALSKHRECIGTRYIELFRSTMAEVQQVLNRCLEPKIDPMQLPPLLSRPQLLPQHIITSGTRKDCVRLRGLPYEAQVEHILNFLGDHAKNIIFQGVHMVYNAQGQPSGEAFIQMDTEQSAFETAQLKHHRYMVFGKKQRYIEVFQCSGEDMNLILSGGIPTSASPPKHSLLSPGMLTPLPPTNIPPPPPPAAQLPQNLSLPWDNSALFAQQQAQMIAQQNLIARQNQAQQQAHSDLLFMNQMNLMGPLSPSASKPPHLPLVLPQHQTPLVFLPPRVTHLGLPRPMVAYPPQLLASGAPQGMLNVVPHVAVKRTYGDAFNEQTTPAKRAYQAQGAVHYQHFYPNI